ncbi:MAG: DUF86 domain-containing protein [Candidatus Kapaibacterium sp.]
MSERIPVFLLQDMLEAVERMLSYTTNLTYDKFVEDLKTVVHDYFGIDFQIVWRIATHHLPPLSESLRNLLSTLK